MKEGKKRKPIADLPKGVNVIKWNNLWRVRVGSRFGLGEPVVKCFSDLEAAKSFIMELTAKRGQSRESKLAPAQLSEAIRCFEFLSDKGTLWEAVQFYLKHSKPTGVHIEWGTAIDKWIATPRKHPLGKVTQIAYRNSVRLFGEWAKKKKINEVTKKDVEEYISEDDWERATVAHHLRNLKIFFSWCLQNRYVGANPAQEIPLPSDEGKIEILTPGEVMHLLENAPDEMKIPLALAAFAGLRTSEIRRLTWNEIGETEIEISHSKTKTRKTRMVTIQPNLSQWLSLVSKSSRRSFVAPQDDWREKWDQTMLAAGYNLKNDKGEIEKEWPRNCLRHSFGTYYFSFTKNEQLVYTMMGNSPTMVHQHYRRNVPKERAEAYFYLAPSGTEKIKVVKFSS